MESSHKRRLLLAVLPVRFRGTLPDEGPPAARLRSDLRVLQSTPALMDFDAVPLAAWLHEAERLTYPRLESAVFRRALDDIRRPQPRSAERRDGSDSDSDPPEIAELDLWDTLARLFTDAASTQWLLERARIPRHRLQSFGEPTIDLWWRGVGQALRSGLVAHESAEVDLIDAALGRYPGNGRLLELRASRRRP